MYGIGCYILRCGDAVFSECMNHIRLSSSVPLESCSIVNFTFYIFILLWTYVIIIPNQDEIGSLEGNFHFPPLSSLVAVPQSMPPPQDIAYDATIMFMFTHRPEVR